MSRYSVNAKRNSSKALVAEFDWIIQPLLNISFRGSKVSWLNLFPMSPRSSVLQPSSQAKHLRLETEPWFAPSTLASGPFFKSGRRRRYLLSTFVAAAARPRPPLPPKTDNILSTCSHKGSRELSPPLVRFFFIIPNVRLMPLLVKQMVFVGKMCAQSFKRRQREGKSDGSRLHTSRPSSICTFTVSDSNVPECDSLIFAVWPFHATHLLIRPFLRPPRAHAASFKAFPLSPYNPSNLRAAQ